MRALVTGIATLLSGCFGPSLPANLQCDEGLCPAGLNCNTATNLCEVPGQDSIDGAIAVPDATADATADGSTAFLLDCPADTNLLLCLDFEDLPVRDASTYDQTINGFSIELRDGIEGTMALNSVESTINMSSTVELPAVYPLTVEVFVYLDMNGGEQYALEYAGFFRVGHQGSFRAALFENELAVLSQAPEVARWYHLGLIADDDRFEFYIDGVIAATAIAPAEPDIPNADITLGRGANMLHRWVGAIDGVRVWRTARSAAQMCQAAGPLCAD